ncbi:MAG: hypothetical protein AAGA66_07935 [Bacteroidota bacterium]
MRLGQLARKHDLPVQEVITYLESKSSTLEPYNPNSKLDEATENQVLDYFEIAIEEPELTHEPEQEELTPQPIPEPETHTEELTLANENTLSTESPIEELVAPVVMVNERSAPVEVAELQEPEPVTPDPVAPDPVAPDPATPMDDIMLAEGEIEFLPEKKHEAEIVAETERIAMEPEEVDQTESPVLPKEEEVIQTDQLLELLESEETPPDLDKIRLIKAPKRELSGLKVLGKVTLPEPKKKEDKNKSEKGNNAKPQLSEEERERRRLKAKRKKEAYEARQQKRRKEEETQKQKALKEAHYKQKLERAQAQQVKQKHNKHKKPELEAKAFNERNAKPKTVLGKFWRWLNT